MRFRSNNVCSLSIGLLTLGLSLGSRFLAADRAPCVRAGTTVEEETPQHEHDLPRVGCGTTRKAFLATLTEAVEEQSSVTTEIDRNASRVAEADSVTASAPAGTNRTAEELSTLADELKSMVARSTID